MKIFIKVIDGVVMDYITTDVMQDDTWIEVIPGVVNKIPLPGDYHDLDLNMFFTPVPENAVIN